MAGRSETAIVALVLLAAGGVLAAPVLGRLDLPRLAGGVMALAAGCGLGAFGVAAAATLRAARGRDARQPAGKESR